MFGETKGIYFNVQLWYNFFYQYIVDALIKYTYFNIFKQWLKIKIQN